MSPKLQSKTNFQVRAARKALRSKGHTYESAAQILGVTFSHLSKVMTGARESRILCQRIESLPNRSLSKK